jgi:ABC-type antimicrobial peptide transport system permease subunit
LFYRTPIKKELVVVLAVPLGALSAVKQGSTLDYLTRMVTFTGISVPIVCDWVDGHLPPGA